MSTGGEDHSYFRSVEDHFIALRGSPFLLSPADWQVARDWRKKGIPLDLVQRTLEELFERRRSQGKDDKIQSLRYCNRAVLAAAKRHAEMMAPEGEASREPEALMDVEARLVALAEALPKTLPDRQGLQERIRDLGGSAEEVEVRLTSLDRDMLRLARPTLSEAQREKLGAKVRGSLAALEDRLSKAELDEARDELRTRLERELLDLPLLSLFSPEALSQT